MRASKPNGKITADHLKRKAIVYLRQSSLRQVRQNTESQRLQYALKDKVKEWGWREIEVIDQDLGCSASVGAAIRGGFERLIASVAIGEVGIILNREASRLSRTDKDWCRLLEVCGVFDTLLSDGEQVYDPNCMDDQLVLGIKGTLSVVELKILRKRLTEGMEAKAERAAFKKRLPPGYKWDETGQIVKDPDERVRDAVALVFKKFVEIQSIRQTFLWFHDQQIELPVTTDSAKGKRIIWQLPKKSFIKSMLKNPCYAGVYAWGVESTKLDYVDGTVRKRRVRLRDVREARVFKEDSHEGYIGVDRFEEIQEMIMRNSLSHTKGERVGAAREGQGLLGGIVRCGRCGRKLYVAYYGKSGTAARYVCRGDYESGGKYCLAFGGSTVDKAFSKELLRIISPYGMQASIEAQKTVSIQEGQKGKSVRQKVAQLEYETTRASEQYNEVDPRNRLVAAELEKRWNEKLEELQSARRALSRIENNRHALTEQEREKVVALGEQFSDVWQSDRCANSLRKKIIRTVIREVIVDLNEDSQHLEFIIHWQGGCHTVFEMLKPPSGVGRKTNEEDLEIIRKMSVGYGDADIARVLNKLQRTTATGKRWNQHRVETIRGKYGIAGHTQKVEHPDVLTLGGAAKYLEVSATTIKRLVRDGVVENRQTIPWAPWEIAKSELDSERIRAIIVRLRKTGKLCVGGTVSESQELLFENM
jgi:DNA invertase Pin-like site-specific DNA recombinase